MCLGRKIMADQFINEQIPYRYDKSNSTISICEQFLSLEAGTMTDCRVSVAGRVMLLRTQGKVAFAELRDESGEIQLFARSNDLADFSDFTDLSLGDWIGASGLIGKTRRGELSVFIDNFSILAKARRGFGDKWHGITDIDARYRQRYVDLWTNQSSRKILTTRFNTTSRIRRFLEERGFIEVETPMLHPLAGGALARPFKTHHNALSMDLFLRIAPELYLKRLIIGGFEKVFEIGRVFRNEGVSPRHNPEFTMLELYQAYADYTDIMELTENLICDLVVNACGSAKITHQGKDLDFTTPWKRSTLEELTSESIGRNISLETPIDELSKLAMEFGIDPDERWGSGKLLLEIYEKTTESGLWGPIFVLDFPREVSPLARDHRSKPNRVERFEVIVAGRELANAFSELTDPEEQKARFNYQVELGRQGDDEAMSMDEDYIRALEYGMPPTGGLGIGIDRLVMLLCDSAQIREVIAFPAMRPERQ